MTKRISTRMKVLAALGIVAVAAVGTTYAAYADDAYIEASMTAGTFDLKFDAGQDGPVTAPYVVSFSNKDALAPGQAATYQLKVYNSGNVPAKLALTSVQVANDTNEPAKLEDALRLTIKKGVQDLYPQGPLVGATFPDSQLIIGANSAESLLDITISMPAATTVAVAGQSITITFNFTATQV